MVPYTYNENADPHASEHNFYLSDFLLKNETVLRRTIDARHHDVQTVERHLSRFEEWLVTKHQKMLLFTVVGLLVFFIAVVGIMWWTDSFSTVSVGYGGIWLLHFIGAASIVVPVPSILALCIAASPEVGLNPLLLGLVAGSAETLGEITGYAVGLSGRNIVQKNRFYPRLHNIMSRYGGKALFLVGVVPNPVFDVMGFAAGSLGYPLARFLIILLAAKTIKSVGLAYACHFGISLIFT